MDKTEKVEQFKNGIFALRTNFGEMAQLMMKKSEGFSGSGDNAYDLKSKDGKRVEVKFSRAYKKEIPVTEENVVDLCSNCSTMIYDSSEAESRNSDYDCNIQQLKPDCFDVLYYGVFFGDKIEVFKAERDAFPETLAAFLEDKKAARKKLPGYALQHKGGEECQFHIKKTTHKHHYKNYHLKDITYEELYDLFATEE